MRLLIVLLAVAAAAFPVPQPLRAAESLASGAVEDWYQFHGPRRDNLSHETGLLTAWPDGGPPLIWKTAGIGHGFATVSIAGQKLFTAGDLDGKTMITALDHSGKILWQSANGPAYERQYPGARGTPTVVDGKVYHLNGDGDVGCFDAAGGEALWSVNLTDRFGGRSPQWGLAESVIIDGEKLICCPGGEKVGVVALNKDTGETIWTSTGIGDRPAYASGIIVEHAGLRQFITTMSASVVGVDLSTGRLLWRWEQEAPYGVNVATPVYHGGHVAVSTTWGRGTTKLKLVVEGGDCSVEKVWHSGQLDNETGGFILAGGYLYGLADGNHRRRHWVSLDWTTGELMYDASGPGRRQAATSYADGMLYLLGEEGTMALARAVPEKFEIISQFNLPKGPEGPAWAHPVIHGGRLYLRHSDWLYAHDIRAAGSLPTLEQQLQPQDHR